MELNLAPTHLMMRSYKRFLKAVDEASREGDSNTDCLIVTRGTAHSAQGKNEAVVSVACERSTDPAIDITKLSILI